MLGSFLKKLSVLLFVLFLLEGCTQTRTLLKEPKAIHRAGTARVLLMPMEIELAELTVGGLWGPKADWTEAAKTYLAQAVEEQLSVRGALVVRYRPPTEDHEKAHQHHQLIKLHNAVGSEIIRAKYGSNYELPTKRGKFDWTLGRDVNVLREDYAADYALFLFVRDSYATTERKLLSLVLTGLLLFPVTPGGSQVAFASLVNLRDGDIEWFNRLVSYTGDLRDQRSAQKTVSELLAKLPL